MTRSFSAILKYAARLPVHFFSEIDLMYQPLEDVDPRVTVLPLSGFLWDTYEELSVLGFFKDVEKEDWSKGSHNLSKPVIALNNLLMNKYQNMLTSNLYHTFPPKSMANNSFPNFSEAFPINNGFSSSVVFLSVSS